MIIPSDKAYHFVVGFLIAVVVGLYNPAYGLGCAVVAGLGKEIRDKVSGKGTPELLDFIATVAGGLLGYMLLY